MAASARDRHALEVRIGAYEVLGELGRGGMGAVYRARGPDGREVAIKVALQDDTGESDAFERERRLLASFTEAEGFVPILDSGHEGRRRWVVMPFLPGGTLRDRLRRGPLPAEEAVSLARKLATALGRAHELGIVHRDLKPENILCTATGEPLVADLGLAKHFRRDVPGASQSRALSETGVIAGTPGYMAPEQIQDAKNVGPACDVFALGVMLHECLAGSRPFPGGMLEYSVSLRSGPRPLPRKAPAWLGPIIQRMLALDPVDRFADGHAVARALAAHPHGASRRKLALAALLLAAGVGLVVALLPSEKAAPKKPPPPPPTLDPSVVARMNALRLATRAQEELSSGEVSRSLDDATSAIDLDPRLAVAWTIRAWAEVTRRDFARAVEDATRAIELDPRLASAFEVRARAREEANDIDIDRELEDLTRAVELDPARATAWAYRATTRILKGDFAEALADSTRAIELDDRLAFAWALRADLHARRDELEQAIADSSRAIDLAPEIHVAWRTRGLARARRGELESAIADFTRALELSPDDPESLRFRGQARVSVHDVAGARADLGRFLQLAPAAEGSTAARQWLAQNRE